MPDDYIRDVTQDPIIVRYKGIKPFRSVTGVNVPIPPEGVDSQQIFDWACITAVMLSPHPWDRKMRVVQVYAKRWSITTVEGDPDDPRFA